MTPAVPLLAVDGLAKGYGAGDSRVTVLDHVDARIDAGEFVAIVGRSGSGKSTLLNLLAGLEEPDEGVVRYRGVSLGGMTDRDASTVRRRHFGFVFQAYNLIPVLTVLENLLLPLSLAGRAGETSRTEMSALLDDVGLVDVQERYPEELSGGEQQRLAVIRAVAHEPDVVFADEPTGNLDLETARQTLALLERYTVERGRTLIMATHSVEMLGAAHRILTIAGGRLSQAPLTAAR